MSATGLPEIEATPTPEQQAQLAAFIAWVANTTNVERLKQHYVNLIDEVRPIVAQRLRDLGAAPDEITTGHKKPSTTSEHFETCSKKGRGRAQKSLDLIDAMRAAAEAAQPITGRGIGYKLFTAGLIPSMAKSEMQRVYRLLREAREDGTIPWEWIVDETRSLERNSTWADPAAYARTVAQSYRRDFWDQQPVRCEVWSEKGTIRGVVAPILDEYAVGFRVMHGFGSATSVYEISQDDDDGRPLIALYIGDRDPSGLYMSEHDLPDRLDKYDGDHVEIKRVALTDDQTLGLPSFPASDKKKDPRYPWYVRNCGDRCWELDALDPNVLRTLVEEAIKAEIEPIAWERCGVVNKAEQESLRSVLGQWGAS